MNTKKRFNRKCSALLAAGAGAAVCLSGGGAANAAIVTGNPLGSKLGLTAFPVSYHMRAFTSKVTWSMHNRGGSLIEFRSFAGSPLVNGTGGASIAMHNADVTIGTGMSNGFGNDLDVPTSVTNKYIAVQFQDGGTRYGWLRVPTMSNGGKTIHIDLWGYENAGATIKTLAESVVTQQLALSDGRVKLHWTNANEDGVARYEVQSKDASGEWQAVDSDTPGEGHYSATVAKDAQCRLVVEKVDGTTEAIDL